METEFYLPNTSFLIKTLFCEGNKTLGFFYFPPASSAKFFL